MQNEVFCDKMWQRKILADIKLHAEMGSRLAAGYWRQVGNFEMP